MERSAPLTWIRIALLGLALTIVPARAQLVFDDPINEPTSTPMGSVTVNGFEMSEDGSTLVIEGPTSTSGIILTEGSGGDRLDLCLTISSNPNDVYDNCDEEYTWIHSSDIDNVEITTVGKITIDASDLSIDIEATCAGPCNVTGGAGDDIIRGGANADTLRGEDGVDKIYGGDGNDRIYGGENSDKLYGEGGDDKINGNNGYDTIEGGSGADQLYGNEDGDTISGGDGADEIGGNEGDDVIEGNGGDDVIYGHGGDDYLFGNDDDDTIFGDFTTETGFEGDDTIDGGAGTNTIVDFNAETEPASFRISILNSTFRKLRFTHYCDGTKTGTFSVGMDNTAVKEFTAGDCGIDDVTIKMQAKIAFNWKKKYIVTDYIEDGKLAPAKAFVWEGFSGTKDPVSMSLLVDDDWTSGSTYQGNWQVGEMGDVGMLSRYCNNSYCD